MRCLAELADKVVYNNYLDKVSELERITGKKYSYTNNQWTTPGTPNRDGLYYMETNLLINESGLIKYTKHNMIGYVTETFTIDFNLHRNSQLDKLL